MPRGRAPGYALQREEILVQAAELFARQGYTATSMNQVAAACGVSKPALYHYVSDKYQLLVEIAAGHIARLQALVAATRNGAAVCGVGDELGTIEVGKLADLIVVGGNPLEDIQNVRQLKLVLKEGVVVSDKRG